MLQKTAFRIISFFGSLLAYLLVATQAFADTIAISPPPGSIPSDIDPSNIPNLIIKLLFGLAIFLFIAYMMYGGIKWITSRGDREAVESARKHLTAAVIGLIIVAGTFLILQLLFGLFGAENPLQRGFELPSLK
ncbi:hypothetical protein HYW46_06195 [Candidatus Daviesbacteria bacterium]|nr:hypothetical protein [Candidatus Daviesbacteria bacterium]